MAGWDLEVTVDEKSIEVKFAFVSHKYIAYAPLKGVQGSMGEENRYGLSWNMNIPTV